MWVRAVLVAMVALVAATAQPAAASEKAAAKSGNTITARVPQNYVQLPKLRLAVPLDDNRIYRMLELEVWLAMSKPEDAAKLGSEKAKIAVAMKELFMGYKWEAFVDPDTGIELAKSVVRASIDKSIKNGPPIDDVLIRTMILR